MMEDEFDYKYKHLYQEYVALRSRPEFIVTDHIYTTFSPIQAAFEELFTYGILHSKEIKGKIDFVLSVLTIPEAHIAEHMEAINSPSVDSIYTNTERPINGYRMTQTLVHL